MIIISDGNLCRCLDELSVQQAQDSSISIAGNAILIKINGSEDDQEKKLLVSWVLQVCSLPSERDYIMCPIASNRSRVIVMLHH